MPSKKHHRHLRAANLPAELQEPASHGVEFAVRDALHGEAETHQRSCDVVGVSWGIAQHRHVLVRTIADDESNSFGRPCSISRPQEGYRGEPNSEQQQEGTNHSHVLKLYEG